MSGSLFWRASTYHCQCARLYLGGAYLRLVSEQAIIQGGRRDPDLAVVIVRLTQDLLAPGVHNSIDSLRLSASR